MADVWLIYFEDSSQLPELYTDETVAMKRWENISLGWNAHLFKRIRCNFNEEHCIGNTRTPPPHGAEEREVCTWYRLDHDARWHADCGASQTLSPSESRRCFNCGKRIEVRP